MADKYLVEPDIEFINQVVGLGGDTLKKCFQCATCSVACPIAPETKPFPRKEMVAAAWGLKDRLVGNGDIWLCHQCGDCSTLCPRGAKPGDVLGAIRSIAIAEYARPKALGKMINDPKKLGLLTAVPAVVFIVMAIITQIFPALKHETHGAIAHANFISTWMVDLVFVPLAGWVVAIFGLGLNNFIKDMHANAMLEGKTDKDKINWKEFGQAFINVLPKIMKHKQFSECGENKDRSTAHMMVLFAFIGLFIVTNIFFVTLYGFHIPGPYSQLNPVKWVANIAGISLIIGAVLMIINRRKKTDQVSTFKDWYLIGLVLLLGVTGMLSEMTRLAGAKYTTYLVYYIHLICVFHLFAYLPFSKMAHFVYRTVAMTYAEYGNRK